MDEGFCFERGQPENRSLHIYVFETIDPPLIPQQFNSAGTRWVLLDFLSSLGAHIVHTPSSN
jgi:hypothetical protein